MYIKAKVSITKIGLSLKPNQHKLPCNHYILKDLLHAKLTRSNTKCNTRID